MDATAKNNFKKRGRTLGSPLLLSPFEGLIVVFAMAEWTGLEPATPGVTGRYSNQLNYHSESAETLWWVLTGSNRRHSPCKGDALPN